jgi:hypothetical protein
MADSHREKQYENLFGGALYYIHKYLDPEFDKWLVYINNDDVRFFANLDETNISRALDKLKNK